MSERGCGDAYSMGLCSKSLIMVSGKLRAGRRSSGVGRGVRIVGVGCEGLDAGEDDDG